MVAFNDSNNNHTSQEGSKLTTRILSPNVRRIEKTRRLKSPITAHRIDGWVIQESLEPFPEKENKLSSIKQEQQIVSNESKVQQWNINDVCVFFENVLSKDCYAPVIEEHLIDGIALLLLKEEHLIKTFKMPSESRTKILDGINKLRD